MLDAVTDTPASSSEYNKLIDNIQDLDARLGAVVSASTAHARLNTLETRTTDTTTGGSTLGIGNQRLADRLGTGVSNTTNVTTGTATAQLTDLRSRVSTNETTLTSHDSRLTALEGAPSGSTDFTQRGGTNTAIGGGYTLIPFATTEQGSNAGLTTADNITFTMSPGLWTVTCSLKPGTSAAAIVAALWSGTGTNPFSGGTMTELYSVQNSAATGSDGGCTLTADIYVAVATTKTVRVSAFASPTSSLIAAGTYGHPRITFRRLNF